MNNCDTCRFQKTACFPCNKCSHGSSWQPEFAEMTASEVRENQRCIGCTRIKDYQYELAEAHKHGFDQNNVIAGKDRFIGELKQNLHDLRTRHKELAVRCDDHRNELNRVRDLLHEEKNKPRCEDCTHVEVLEEDNKRLNQRLDEVRKVVR